MPATVTRLRIAGFKSFAEPTTIDILPGLTGIVGPNGCGKSNVVEALRWAMGEANARNLRGGEMDEVIFAGSAARPARSIAEVVVTLDDATGLAPPPLEGEHELQVSRQIERGAGSTYRVNGREMRARDVQTIFADLASGARSSAMVSQGRVAFLVDARPEDRRSVLEEAAGITGLHARRHEAELRLRAAETNLARVSDLRASLGIQHAALTGQAEAARTYRLAVDECAAAERALLGVLLGRAARARSEAAGAAASAASDLAAAEQASLDAQAAEYAAEVAFGEGSGEASLAAALLERARAGFAAAEAHERRAAEALEAADARLAENMRDQSASLREAEAADAAHRALTDEANALKQGLGGFDERHAAAVGVREAASVTVTREAERSQARRLADAVLAAARISADEAAHRVSAAREALARALAAAPTAGAIEEAADRRAQTARSCEAASEALAMSEQHRRTAEDATASMAREAAGLDEAAARADQRWQTARQRRDRIVNERDEAAGRLATATAARIGPGERSRLSEAAESADRTVVAAIGTLEAAGQRLADSAEASRIADLRALEAAGRARDAEAALEQATNERDRLARLQASLTVEQARLDAERAADADLTTARDAVAAHADALDAARRRAGQSEQDREAALAATIATRADLGSHDAQRAAVSAELGALSTIAGDETEDTLLAMLDVPEPLEPALAAAFGEALAASLDPNAARHWRDLGPLTAGPTLPPAAKPLLALLAAPAAMSRSLSQTGLIDDPADALSLQSTLLPGQALVTADGSLFRWDGHVVRGGRVTREAERLRARRRVAECRAALAVADARLPLLDRALSEATARHDAATAALSEARAAIERHDAALAAARTAALSLATRDAEARARIAAVTAERERVDAALAEANARETAAQSRADAAGDAPTLAALAREIRLSAGEAATAERDARQSLRASEAALTAADAAARQLAAREEEAAALLATLEPALSRLSDEAAQAESELAEATAERGRILAAHTGHVARSSAAATEHQAVLQIEDEHRRHHATALAEYEEASRSHADLVRLSRDAATRIAILEPDVGSTRAADAGAASRMQAAATARAALGPETDALEAAMGAQADAQRHVADLEARADQDRARLLALAAAIPDAAGRRDVATDRATELHGRLAETRDIHATLLDQAPALAEASRHASQALATAEAVHSAASQRAESQQAGLAARRDHRRAADATLLVAREAAQRAGFVASQAETASTDIEARAAEADPNIVPAESPTASAEADAKRRLAGALKARDQIGPVNLLAEREAAETGERLAALAREADELDEAVARLRGSIGHLNREGRERLSASFVQIDAQFRALFGRMFDGGRAHLALVGSDDPLQAGLEIYAQPPGKKLATLSLLSGGEQALTALSLIFAAFRCNPAPVCVLDEVDAPLDDANVERFCRLVSDMARETGTRFLVVTHHQVTMANMDRLYGVTMQERGVSRMLSVDLGTAESLVT